MSSGFLINGSAGFMDDAIARLSWQRGLRSNPARRNAAQLEAQAAELRLECRVFSLGDSAEKE